MEDEKHCILESLQETISKLRQKLKVMTDERDELSRERDELSSKLVSAMAEGEEMYRLAERRGVEVQRRNSEIRFLMEKVQYFLKLLVSYILN